VPRGTEGAVSLEGTLAGLGAAAAYAAVATAIGQVGQTDSLGPATQLLNALACIVCSIQKLGYWAWQAPRVGC
jgi:uncharacterized membrane protein